MKTDARSREPSPRRRRPAADAAQGADGYDHELAFGSRPIRFRVCRSRGRRLRIAVTPDLRVEVRAPVGVRGERVLEAVRGRLPWIARALDRLAQFHPLPRPLRYLSGETVVYLGRQYRLRVEHGVRRPPRLLGRFLVVSVPTAAPRAAVQRAVEEWYRHRAREVFDRCLAKWGPVARRHGVPDGPWGIRSMRRRWGSCSAEGRITLNTWLVGAPLHGIEYVVVHELCHRLVPGHGRPFHALLRRCLPDWPQRKALLSRLAV